MFDTLFPFLLYTLAVMTVRIYYLKVTIICRYIFLRFWLITPFASTKFYDFYAEMVQGQQILMFYTIIVHIANDCGHKFLCFGPIRRNIKH